MSTSQHDQSNDSNPTPAEIFRVFRQTITASIAGLRLLLGECADLRAELVTVHNLRNGGDGDGVFSARQQNRILELQEAAKDMQALMVSFPCRLQRVVSSTALPVKLVPQSGIAGQLF